MAEIKGWITIRGNHIPLMEGESKKQALRRFIDRARQKNKINSYKGKMVVEGTNRYFLTDDGRKIEYLSTSEYNKLGDKLRDSLDENEKRELQTYVDTWTVAGSGELNSLNEDNIGKIYKRDEYYSDKNKPAGLYMWNDDPNNVATLYEKQKTLSEVLKTIPEDIRNNEYKLEDWAVENGYHPEAFSRFASENFKEKSKEEIDTYIKHNTELRDLRLKEAKELETVPYGSDEYKNIKAKYNIDEKSAAYGLGTNKSDYYYQTNIDKYTKKTEYIKDGNLDFVNMYEYTKRLNSPGAEKAQSEETLERMKKRLGAQKTIDDIFEKKGVVLDKDIIVLRRTRETREQIREGFTHLGYTSTTMKKAIAAKMPSGASFGGEQIEIIIPKGTKILPLKSTKLAELTPKSTLEDQRIVKNVANQNEILLPRNTTFKYVSEVRVDPYDWEKGYKYTMVADTSSKKDFKYKTKRRNKVGEWVYEY